MKFPRIMVAGLLIASSMSAFSQDLKSVIAKLHKFEGKPMPAFTMKGVDGSKVTNASLKGKVVLFDFWATWCGPCKLASPTMEDLYKKYKSKGLIVIGANVLDEPNSNDKAKKYRQEHKFTYPFTSGGDSILKDFGIPGIPAFAIMDRKGILRHLSFGYNDSKKVELSDVIQKLLAN